MRNDDLAYIFTSNIEGRCNDKNNNQHGKNHETSKDNVLFILFVVLSYRINITVLQKMLIHIIFLTSVVLALKLWSRAEGIVPAVITS